jgi:N-acetylglucosamine-6-phosphate deacetylase
VELLGRRYDTGEVVRLEVGAGKIARISAASTGRDVNGDVPWIGPGLIDIQINGYGGQEFNAPEISAEKVARIVDAMTPFGVTRICPTVTTEGFAVLRHAMKAIHEACETMHEVRRRVAGIHLEGPYLSMEDGCRGAHPKQHCRPPDWDEFQRLQEAAGGQIRILTLAPEYDGSSQFIERVAATGVIVALGHTAATTEQIRAAVDAGARFSTHLGNGSHQILRRHPNYIWAQLAEDRLTAGMIVDGHHLPPEVVKVFLRAKGTQRCVLTSDLSGMAGLPPGRYPSNLCEIEILAEGRMVVAGQRAILAGAALPLSVAIGNVIHFADVDLGEAIRMASAYPAELLGIRSGTLAVGQRADLVLFDMLEPAGGCGPRQFTPRRVFVEGEPAYETP